MTGLAVLINNRVGELLVCLVVDDKVRTSPYFEGDGRKREDYCQFNPLSEAPLCIYGYEGNPKVAAGATAESLLKGGFHYRELAIRPNKGE